MAVNKNFVVKQGLEVKQNLLVAEGSTSRIGIGTTAPLYTTHVIGGIGATDLYVSGVSTFSGAIDANGAIDVDGHTELDDVNVSGASTFTGIGTFISDLYVGGNLNVTGDIVYDEVSGRNLDISGIATIATLGVSIAATTKDLLVTGVSTVSTLKVGTAATINSSGLDVVGIASVGVAITMYGSSGIVSATSFYGDGQYLDNVSASGGGETDITSCLFI